MVEPNGPPRTQLPTAKLATESSGQEESKEESLYMYGPASAVLEDIFTRLEGVEMNKLEEGLLRRFLGDPAQNRQQIENNLRKLQEKHAGDTWSMKKLNRTTPLFMNHEFWGT
mmetsp:Transcript_1821/g.2626  ORF Transcript_1821/g.2626 Transcript_1821/m.2626 type:complete len:113 (+) Transcript_1821:49-387(+)